MKDLKASSFKDTTINHLQAYLQTESQLYLRSFKRNCTLKIVTDR